ncbi:MAG: GPR endopeptidase [Eubacterium sp.]|nr:GPR endopeptidase [Eubacterium sp.]
MKERLYTDLALEERERFEENVEISGVQIEEEYNQSLDMKTTVVTIVNRNGEKKMGKPKGRYVTMESRLFREKGKKGFAEELKKHLISMTDKYQIKKILIVGLGNAEATPDALGPQVAGKIKIREGIYCIAPGVLAQTGMESCEIVKGIVEEVQPDLVLVVDSLASRNLRRVSTTIQLTDTGIVPGSGVGNHRKGLNERTLKKKVFALGVPMVVSGATIVNDTMEKLLQILEATSKNGTLTGVLENYSTEEKYQLFEELLSEETEQTFVTPKDVDEIVENLSDILSEAINLFCVEQVICQN